VTLLEVRGLRAGYEGIPVVFGIDLEVSQGEVVALLGPNGAGKTTTLRALSGMVWVSEGSIEFDGAPLVGRPAEAIARSGLVHIPEGRGIFPSLAIEETLRLAAALSGVGRAGVAGALDEVYETFPRLAERRTQAAGTLSGGEQQMLALARGLISKPKLLLIDEMSQGLAPTIVANLFEIVASFPERGVSVLLVEQFVGQALAVASRAYVLDKGEVGYAGDAATLAADESFVQGSYLGDIEGEPAAVGASRPDRRASGVGRNASSSEAVRVSLPPALLRAIEEQARSAGVNPEDLVQQLIETRLAEDGGGARPAPARAAKAPQRTGPARSRTRRRSTDG